MIQSKPVGEMASAYLKKCGYSSLSINSWTNQTRLLHDLGLCGDDIKDEFRILQDEFGVNLSNFDFKRYFPSELSTDAYWVSIRKLLRILGLGKIVDQVYKKYPEISLEMIESMIKKGKWIPENNQ